MNYSDKQLKIFEAYEDTKQNIAISAAPGAGKTTTLIELLKRTLPTKKCVFLAFNKSIQQELEKKTPDNVDTFTLHSIGYRTLLKNAHNRYKLSEIKNWILGKQVLDLKHIKNDKQKNVYLFIISRLVDLYRMNLCTTRDELMEIADKYNISTINGEIDNTLQLITYLSGYNTMSHKGQMLIDYVDMLWLPYSLLNDDKFPKYNIVMIDESQDLNLLQFDLIQRLMNKRSRFIAVGDPYQAIYSFQGADSDVFRKIREMPNTINLPLSYSYRCGTKIVERANTIFDFIESPSGQHDGEVIENGVIDDAGRGDLVVCRNNAPLVDAFLYLLKNGVKSVILGKDYEKGLISVLNKMEDFTQESITILLDSKKDELRQKGITNYMNNQSYQNMVEKIYILEQLHKEFSSVDKLREVIESMFSDNEKGDAVTLSTIHKAKGSEADNVFVIGFDELIPSKYAVTPTELYAENCLKYVCITRSKRKLIFVNLNSINS